jgi:hypothetical protein
MFYKFSLGIIITAAVLIIAWVLIQLWPVTVLKPNTQPYKILTPKVKVGDQVIYLVDVCKYKNVQGTIERTFVDDVRYPSITSIGNIKPGCTKTKVSVQVPNFVVPGIYHLELNASYKINPFRTDFYQLSTETFEVLGR